MPGPAVHTNPEGAKILALPTIQRSLQKSLGKGTFSISDLLLKVFVYSAALLSVLITFGIVFYLFHEVGGFFSEVQFDEFLFGTKWFPLIGENRSYGVLPLVNGSLLVAVGSCVIAIPLGIGAAVFLSEYLPRRIAIILKSVLEILAGIPTVVYGYFALIYITPQLQALFDNVQIFNALSAIIVVGVMILPTVASISQDALQAVPQSLREAAYGLSARKYQVAMTVVLPAALSGVVASVILAFSRALGETMAVTLAAGATPHLGFNIFGSIQTMTAYIAQVSQGDVPAGTVEYQSIFAVGMLLFFFTLATNFMAQVFVARLAQRYQ